MIGKGAAATTTYTWKDGESDLWESEANWMSESGGCPRSENAKVVIPANTTARIKLREAYTIGGLALSAEGASLTLAQGGSDTNATKLTVSNDPDDL